MGCVFRTQSLKGTWQSQHKQKKRRKSYSGQTVKGKRRKAQQQLGPSARVELSLEGVVRLSSDPLLLRKYLHFPCWEAESETQSFRFRPQHA